MVSLTSLLVLVSLFAQTSGNIPKTSYMKLIDVWFMCIIVFDFALISVVIFIEHVRKKELEDERVISDRPNEFMSALLELEDSSVHERRRNICSRCKTFLSIIHAENLNIFFRIGFPIIYAIFLTTYSLIAM